MQQAAVPGYRLSKAKRSTRVLTSLGLLGLLFGLTGAALLTISRTGVTPETVRAYYLGATAQTSLPDAAGALSDSVAADLGEIVAVNSRRSFAELAEVTHIHVSAGSLLLFLLCHLLSLCRMPDGARTLLYVLAFAAFLITFGSPWLIVYVHPFFSWFFSIAIVSLLVLLVILAAIPLWEMWGTDE